MSKEPRVAGRIRDQRVARRLTQEDLATLSGVAPALISKYERGRISPTLPTLQKIAHALHVEVSALV